MKRQFLVTKTLIHTQTVELEIPEHLDKPGTPDFDEYVTGIVYPVADEGRWNETVEETNWEVAEEAA